MAYRIEERDIVIDGWENGIENNPYSGINELVNANITSIPGELTTGFVAQASTDPTFSGTITSADTGTEVISFTGGSGGVDNTGVGRNGVTAVVVTVTSGLTGITSGNIYWTASNSSGSFVLYSDPDYSTAVNITADGTGSFVSVDVGKITHFAQHTFQINSDYCIDNNGRAWVVESTVGYWKYAGNTIRSGETRGNGIFTMTADDGSDYLFLIGGSAFDYAVLDSSGDISSWVHEWQPSTGGTAADTAILSGAIGATTDHYSLNGQDGRVYICDDTYIVAFYEKDGQTFDPTNTATYTMNTTALALPFQDSATCLAELGAELLVGGKLDYIYPWDRKSPTFRRRIWLAERNTQRMLTVNTTTYIFAGDRGRIYRTGGTNVELFKKMPDHLTNTIDPVITFTDVARHRNQIYFGATVATARTTGTPLDTYNGLWAIDISTGALYQTMTLTGTGADVTAVLFTPQADVASAPQRGHSVFVGWEGDSSTYGIDTTNSNVDRTGLSYPTYAVTDMIPIARLWDRRTFEQVEILLSTPIVSGEAVKVEYRNKLGDSWTSVGDTNTMTTAGDFSAVFPISFENVQWVQFKVSLDSTTNNDRTFTRLREIRVR